MTARAPIPPRADRSRPVFRPADDGKPRTYFVNGEVFAHVRAHEPDDAPAKPPAVRVRRVDDCVQPLRANVRGAARAVLAWVAAVVDHEGDTDLEDVLLRCLRPSADPADVNYAALAEDIHAVTGVKLTAKRVQTAVRHLRRAAEREHLESNADSAKTATNANREGENTERDQDAADAALEPALVSLRRRLAEHFAQLDDPDDAGWRRELGVDLLSAVRAAAGRVIDRGFGEHITDAVTLPALEGRFFDYLRDTLNRAPTSREAQDPHGAIRHATTASATNTETLRHDFRALLLTLADHPLSHGRPPLAEPDVKLVLHGARVVAALLGPDSLPGVLAHLNVLVVGRSLIGTDLYVAEMLRLADTAQALHHDDATQKLLRWCRRQPADAGRKLPGAVRVASYARSNAATRLYERCFTGTIDPDASAPLLPSMRDDASGPTNPPTYLALANRVLADMESTDAGFTLTLTGRLVAHTTHAHLTGQTAAAAAYLRQLGEARALERLEALIRFDNHDGLVAAARRLVESVYPGLKRQLLITRG